MSALREFANYAKSQSTVAQGRAAAGAEPEVCQEDDMSSQEDPQVCQEEPIYTPNDPQVCTPDDPAPASPPKPPEAKLQRITIEGIPNYTMEGDSYPIYAKAEYSDKSTKYLKTEVEWTSSTPVIEIEKGGRVHAKKSGSAKITAKDAKSGISGSSTIKVDPVVLQEIKLSPENATYVGGADTVVGGATQFTATGVYNAGPNKDLTAAVAWSSSDPKVVTIDKKGLANVQGIGTVTITAKHAASGKSASTKLTVESPGAGAKSTKVQIIVKDTALDGWQGIAEFKSPGAKPVTVGGRISGNVLDFGVLYVMPEGSFRFMLVSTGPASGVLTRTISYKMPAAGLMTFNAGREELKATITAKTMQEATDKIEKKVGAKVSAEAGFKIVKIGGEVSGEYGTGEENKKGTEQSIEWQITYPGDLQLSQAP